MNKQPFPDSYTPVLVWLIPALELLGAALLIADKTRLLGLYLCVGLMLVFTVYVSLVIMNFYGHIPCACGGLIASLRWKQHLYLNISYLLTGIIAILLYRRQDKYHSLVVR
ncbi:hypothetical protein CK934_22035 [Chitinophaga sp. MD30]|nr:hypothetical protein CK934_22035 [Chitinophaga sp. MD30]